MAPAALPKVSVVVVVYDMARELPRTIRSLDPELQVGVSGEDYEVIVVDNGSTLPIDTTVLERFSGHIRVERIDPAPPSPASAANQGVSLARHDLVGLLIDGARMVSPGLVARARQASLLAGAPVITAPAFHLGEVPHMHAAEAGYDQAVEDALLAASGWEADGYELFSVSTPAASSARGLFGPMGESNSLFLRKASWAELGGLDERFALPGGGLGNHDLYRRACSQPGAELIVLLGEATFHQYHGGAATSRRFTWDEMHAEYQEIRGTAYRPPDTAPLFLGQVPQQALGYVERSAAQAIQRFAGQRRR